jgi:hypothetical protein
MNDDSILLENIPLPLDPEAIARHVDGSGDKASPLLLESVERLRLSARAWLAPRVLYRIVPVESIAEGAVTMTSGHAFVSKKLSTLFAGAEQLVVAVGTVGEALEDEVARLFTESEYMDAVTLDAIGSVATEEACQYLRYLVCRRFGDGEGLKVGPSLSPGYQYWDLRDQQIIFDLVPAASIGVSLTESFLMHPRKSESAVIPLGRNLRVTAEEDEPPCRFCDRHDCPARTKF